MSIEIPNVIHAMATYNGTTDVFNKNSGFASAVRNGAGDYTLTLEQGVRGIIALTISEPGALAQSLNGFLSTASGTLQVRATDQAGAPIDTTFDVVVFAMPHQNEGF